MITLLVWLLLLVVCWPLAIIALVIYPIVWLILLPFRLLGFAVDGMLSLIRSTIHLPFRLLGARPDKVQKGQPHVPQH